MVQKIQMDEFQLYDVGLLVLVNFGSVYVSTVAPRLISIIDGVLQLANAT